MFDPHTLVHSNKFFTIWHVDPCKDGSDDSCDWFGTKKTNPKIQALGDSIWNLETILDNRPFYPDHEAHLRFQNVKSAYYQLKRREGFRIHPRWHFWHWKVYFSSSQNLKRFLFTKCSKCGGGFKWGESGVTNLWESDGPQWFKSEELQHFSCLNKGQAVVQGDV